MNVKAKSSQVLVLAVVGFVVCGAMAAAAVPAEGNSGILAAYGRMHTALAADSTESVVVDARAIAKMARQMAAGSQSGAALEALAKAAEKVKSGDLAELRAEFKELSVAIAKAVEGGALTGADIYFCSMANGYWLQAKDDTRVRNPYYGSSMLGCGWIVEKVGA